MPMHSPSTGAASSDAPSTRGGGPRRQGQRPARHGLPVVARLRGAVGPAARVQTRGREGHAADGARGRRADADGVLVDPHGRNTGPGGHRPRLAQAGDAGGPAGPESGLRRYRRGPDGARLLRRLGSGRQRRDAQPGRGDRHRQHRDRRRPVGGPGPDRPRQDLRRAAGGRLRWRGPRPGHARWHGAAPGLPRRGPAQPAGGRPRAAVG